MFQLRRKTPFICWVFKIPRSKKLSFLLCWELMGSNHDGALCLRSSTGEGFDIGLAIKEMIDFGE